GIGLQPYREGISRHRHARSIEGADERNDLGRKTIFREIVFHIPKTKLKLLFQPAQLPVFGFQGIPDAEIACIELPRRLECHPAGIRQWLRPENIGHKVLRKIGIPLVQLEQTRFDMVRIEIEEGGVEPHDMNIVYVNTRDIGPVVVRPAGAKREKKKYRKDTLDHFFFLTAFFVAFASLLNSRARFTQYSKSFFLRMPSLLTNTKPRMVRPLWIIGRQWFISSASLYLFGPILQSISSSRTQRHIFPLTMKQMPWNIFFSATSGRGARASLMRVAMCSSKAMAKYKHSS